MTFLANQQIHAHALLHARAHAHTHTHTCSCTHTHTLAHAHTHTTITHTHMHTHRIPAKRDAMMPMLGLLRVSGLPPPARSALSTTRASWVAPGMPVVCTWSDASGCRLHHNYDILHMHTRTHTYTHTHMHSYTHTHTHTQHS